MGKGGRQGLFLPGGAAEFVLGLVLVLVLIVGVPVCARACVCLCARVRACTHVCVRVCACRAFLSFFKGTSANASDENDASVSCVQAGRSPIVTVVAKQYRGDAEYEAERLAVRFVGRSAESPREPPE